MLFAGLGPFGRLATRLATWFVPPYHGRARLAQWSPRGYVSPSADIHHSNLDFGRNVCIDDRVVIYQGRDGGRVMLGDRVHLWRDTLIQTGAGGSVTIGAGTHIQIRCQFAAYKATIHIGCGVRIAPNCSFYPYDHGTQPDELISGQPFSTKGGISVGDDAWLGVGVIVLSGVRIGKGAVIGAGAVVTTDIPDGAIAVGIPARVVKMRDGSERDPQE